MLEKSKKLNIGGAIVEETTSDGVNCSRFTLEEMRKTLDLGKHIYSELIYLFNNNEKTLRKNLDRTISDVDSFISMLIQVRDSITAEPVPESLRAYAEYDKVSEELCNRVSEVEAEMYEDKEISFSELQQICVVPKMRAKKIAVILTETFKEESGGMPFYLDDVTNHDIKKAIYKYLGKDV